LPIKVYNLYGPTETSLAVTYWSCSSTPDDREVPIGRPIDNVSLYVLDENRKPVPEGETGELYIGGVAVGIGYRNLSEKTAESFIAHPFAGSGRLYRTGDFVRSRADRELMYVGRADQQVKLRGVRVELGEIEAQLASNPLVRDAVVLVREFDADDQRLVAYVNLKSRPPPEQDRTKTVRELRSPLQKTMPLLMVPAHFVILAEFPVTDNGKADRRALAKLPVSRTPVTVQQVDTGPKVDEIERRLIEVWSEVLGLDTVDPSDDFFDLGGHSLLAAKIVARLKPKYKLSVQELFQRRTIKNIALLLVERASGRG
jgi:acyl-coenzyme A synthetase/AMP-(fatty) acid ligase/acyl carrier protein